MWTTAVILGDWQLKSDCYIGQDADSKPAYSFMCKEVLSTGAKSSTSLHLTENLPSAGGRIHLSEEAFSLSKRMSLESTRICIWERRREGFLILLTGKTLLHGASIQPPGREREGQMWRTRLKKCRGQINFTSTAQF